MGALGKTFRFVRENKLKSAACVLLDIIFIVVLIISVSRYLPRIQEDILTFNDIMDKAGVTDIGSLTKLSEHSGQIGLIKRDIEKAFNAMILWIVTAASILYSFFLSLVLVKEGKLSYAAYAGRIFLSNIAIMLLLWLISTAIIKIKITAASYGLMENISTSSVFLFIIICYIAYFFGVIAFVEMRRKGWFRKSGIIIKNKGLFIFAKYASAIIGLFLAMVLLNVPFIISSAAIIKFLAFIISVVIFLGYFTLSKIYLIEMIKSYE